jgi:hypothetical protein
MVQKTITGIEQVAEASTTVKVSDTTMFNYLFDRLLPKKILSLFY